MKRFSIAAWAGFTAYALVIYIAGPAGFPAMASLERERSRMEANLADLQRINRDLADGFVALGTQRGREELEARDLGYVKDGEVVVRLEGLPPAPPAARVAGSVIRRDGRGRTTNALPAAAGLAAFAFAFLIASLGADRKAEKAGDRRG